MSTSDCSASPRLQGALTVGKKHRPERQVLGENVIYETWAHVDIGEGSRSWSCLFLTGKRLRPNDDQAKGE